MKDNVYLLWHCYESELSEDEKFIGAYISEEDAKIAIARLKSKPGFCNYPEGFEISTCKLGKDNWEEGFSAMTVIQVRVLGEAAGDSISWVNAALHPNDIYEICSVNEGEVLEFSVGDLVRCNQIKTGPDSYAIMAVEKVENVL